jgi:hypothetical protein
MENNTKTNKLAIISFICGLIALISIGSIFAGYNMTEPTPAILFITDGILMPIRNISVVAALIIGIFALRDLKKKDRSEKGKWLAWAGIIMGGAWIIFGVFVGLLFSVSSFAQLW